MRSPAISPMIHLSQAAGFPSAGSMVSQGRFHAHPASLLALPPPPLPPAVVLSQLTFRFLWNPESDLEMEEEGYALLPSQLPESWAPGDSCLGSSVSDLSQMLGFSCQASGSSRGHCWVTTC